MLTVIAFVVVLGVLIFIHELGHFAVAKWSGVGVEKFSLGFGPKIVGKKWSETEYLISLLPLGGYVKMVGESTEEEVTDSDKARSFSHKPVGTRSAIVAAGPIMNLVLAAVVMPLVYIIGVNIPAFMEEEPVVGYVVEDAPADEAGVLKGDVIEKVDGKEIGSWEALLSELALSPGRSLEVTLRRGGQMTTVTMTPEASDTGAGFAGILPPMEPNIGAVTPGYPAEEAGLKARDRVVAVGGQSITHWAELEDAVHDDDTPKTFTVQRGSETFTTEIRPRYNEQMGVYLIGISRAVEEVTRRYGFVEAVVKGTANSIDLTAKLFVVIKGLVVGQYSVKTLGGPIMIAQVAGQAAQSGLSDLLSLVAFLSLQLGIINLFPIPVLDGGHLLFFGIEAAKGSPLSEKFMHVAHQVGIVLLIALMLLVTYNDLFRIFGG